MARRLVNSPRKDTVDTALCEYVARTSRARAWSEAQKTAADALDLDLLDDKNSYRPRPAQS